MKILIALDTREYSRKIIKNVARLAENTLADIVFLSVQEKSDQPAQSVATTLLRYRQDFSTYFASDESPYAAFQDESFRSRAPGDWFMTSRGIKEFSLRIRSGSVVKQIINVAGEVESDLIILGCSGKGDGCEWDGELNVPLRVAEDAPCSVMVIKQVKKTNQLVTILDQSAVSQDSMELVSQMVTLHDAGLKIVGVKEKKARKERRLEERMVSLLKYYNDREINTWIKLINSEEVQSYVTSLSKEAIVALWMGGQQSLLKKIFSRTMVDRLLETTRSSLLILR